MARYRRGRISRGDGLAATAVSLAVGAGAALATWYVTRLFLSREELPPRALKSDGVGVFPVQEPAESPSDSGG